MKSKNRYIVIVLVFLVTVFLVTGGHFFNTDHKVIVDEQPPQEPKQEERSIIQYIPILKDYQWIYSVDNSREDYLLVSVEFLKDNVVQLRFKGFDTDIIKIYTYEEDGFYEVATIENVSYKVDHTTTRQYKKPLLKLPLEEQSTWYLNSTEYVTIESIDQPHTGILGISNAIEVTYTLEDKTIIAYFGDKRGLLEMKIVSRDSTLGLSLEAIQTDSITTQLINVSYIQAMDKSLDPTLQEVTIRTNEEPRHFLTDVLKVTPGEGYLPTLPAPAFINSIYYDSEQNIAYVDLSKEYIQDFTSKNYQEAADLSLITTIGNYYYADFINITIEGEIYKPSNLTFIESKGIEVKENRTK